MASYFDPKYITDLPLAGLKRWGVTDPSQIGVRTTYVGDPTAGEGSAASIEVPQFYNKATGETIGVDGTGYLGEGPSLGVDASGKVVGVNPSENEGFFRGLIDRTKDILTNPGVQYIGTAALLGNAAAGALGAGGAGAATTGGGGLSDLALAEAADAGLAGVGTNVGAGLSDLALAGAADAGLTGVGANVGEAGLSDLALAGAADAGLTGVGANVGAGLTDAELAAAADAGLTNVGNNVATTVGPGLGGLSTAAKLATLGLGAKGISSLMAPQTGTGGGGGSSDGFNPVGGFTFDPSKFQATTPDAAWFRPGSEITTVADAARRAKEQGYAAGGQTQSQKPKFTNKAALKAMSPWERASAELNNAAYMAHMPTGVAAPQAGIAQLGQFAHGGGVSNLGGYSDGGRMLKGGGDGMSDSIPATIGNRQPARLADGEFVIPADVVSGLGNGSTDAGARQLYKMMDRVRQARTGTKKQGKEINAQKHMPV